LRTLPNELRAVSEGTSPADENGFDHLLEWVLELRHAAAAARAVPPDQGGVPSPR
jgi:hypothetical protein